MNKILEHLNCTICMKTFENPKSLPCQHTFCSECLKSLLIEHKKYHCPVCRDPIHERDPKNYRINLVLKQIIDQIDGIDYCDKCSKTPGRKCRECALFCAQLNCTIDETSDRNYELINHYYLPYNLKIDSDIASIKKFINNKIDTFISRMINNDFTDKLVNEIDLSNVTTNITLDSLQVLNSILTKDDIVENLEMSQNGNIIFSTTDHYEYFSVTFIKIYNLYTRFKKTIQLSNDEVVRKLYLMNDLFVCYSNEMNVENDTDEARLSVWTIKSGNLIRDHFSTYPEYFKEMYKLSDEILLIRHSEYVTLLNIKTNQKRELGNFNRIVYQDRILAVFKNKKNSIPKITFWTIK
jgi:hypothetical protein